MQVHTYPNDPHVRPGPLGVVGGIVAAGDRTAVRFDRSGRGQCGGGGVIGWRGGVDVQTRHGGGFHMLR